MFQRLKSLVELKKHKLQNWIEPPEQKIEFYLDKTTKIRDGYSAEHDKLSDAIYKLRRAENDNNKRIRRLQNEAYNETDESKRYAKLEVAYYQQLRTDIISTEIKAYDKRISEVNKIISEINGKIETLKLQAELHKIKKDLEQPGIEVSTGTSFDPNSINDFLDQINISNAVHDFASESPDIADKDEWISKRLGERTVC